MTQDTLKTLKGLIAFSVLATSLVIALAGFYIILERWTQGGDILFPLLLSISMAILILLILTMMFKYISGHGKNSERKF
ncbi:MAG: hypothetical protein ACE5IO_01750 [Thermoplasmata archaeon]